MDDRFNLDDILALIVVVAMSSILIGAYVDKGDSSTNIANETVDVRTDYIGTTIRYGNGK